MNQARPLRLLHLYKDYYPVLGGIENHVRLVAEAQAAQGHDVTVLVTGHSRRTRVERLNGVRVIYAGRLATLASTPLSLALPARLRAERPQLTHLHFPYPVGDAAQQLFGGGRPVIISYHSDIVRQKTLLRFYAPWLRRALARANAILVASPPYARSSPFLAPHAGKCRIVPYGIEPSAFAQADPAAVAGIQAAHPGSLVLFVGKLRYYKGVETLIEAMGQVAAPARALLIGGDSTQRRDELEALARRVGAAERVNFLGEVEGSLAPYYHASQVFVLPSIERSEAFGIVQLEALAAGRPVVSTELGTGTSWVNQHEVTGLVVAPRDPAALAAALNRLLADAALRARMGAAGRARVESTFTQARMVAQIEAVYRSVLER